MAANQHQASPHPSPDQVEQALRSFWRGSPAEFDRLVNEGEPTEIGICSLLADIIGLGSRREHSHNNEPGRR